MLEFVMKFFTLTEHNYQKAVTEAAVILNAGGIIAFATESYYAVGVIAMNEKEVRRIFDLKNRPLDKPIPLIVSDRKTLCTVAEEVPDQAHDLMKKFWPGPLTLIFKARTEVPTLITGSSGKVAVRVPGDSTALQIAKAIKKPVTATSANLSSMPPAVNARDVLSYFGDNIDLILDGGQAPGGKPSTILDVTVTPPRILRQGSIILT
ncbi:MAG: threonylcarbamoyl-AMP synthase [Nitrospiraceae bacterium]|nr:MAG: threonylcarbamoyl-AMP synthase [Nitrospiraceae bacterium]